MLLLLCSILLLAANIQADPPEPVSEDVGDERYDTTDLLKYLFNMYYDRKGLKNETTETMVEEFFEHKFEPYPIEVFPAFQKIFQHIAQSNDRIWNFYESILFLFRNVDAADRIYETVMERAALGNLLTESGELHTDAPIHSEEQIDGEYTSLKHRSGVILEEEPPFVWDERPCGNECGVEPLQVGSIRAIPGVHFPNYEDIPITSFTCAGKHIPGFYADLDTGCQVFHVCYPHRRESFLCPIGTTFNQAILACDYWYSSNCSLAPSYFQSNLITESGYFEEGTGSFVDQLLEQYDEYEHSTTTQRPVDYPTKKPGKPKSPKIKISLPNIDWTLMIKFLPIKSKITECPDFCGKPIESYPIESTTSTLPPVQEYTTVPTMKPTSSTPAATTVPPKKVYDETTALPNKDKFGEKTVKSEILLDILKAVEVLTKDAEGFLTEMVQKKRQHHVPSGIEKDVKYPQARPTKPHLAPQHSNREPKPFPEINTRFVVRAVQPTTFHRPKVSGSKLLKPSKPLGVKKQNLYRKKEPAKLILEGMKAIAHLFN